MKFLCLAYGDEKDWNVLTKKEQDEMLAQDEAVRKRGALMAAVQKTTTTVRAWDGKPITTDGAFADSKAPLAGFSIIEAADLDEVIRLVAGTPCARAKGAIEIRPIMTINDFALIRYLQPWFGVRRNSTLRERLFWTRATFCIPLAVDI